METEWSAVIAIIAHISTYRAELFWEHNICTFSIFPDIELILVAEIIPHGTQAPIYPTVNTFVADDQATQGSRASTATALAKYCYNTVNRGTVSYLYASNTFVANLFTAKPTI